MFPEDGTKTPKHVKAYVIQFNILIYVYIYMCVRLLVQNKLIKIQLYLTDIYFSYLYHK